LFGAAAGTNAAQMNAHVMTPRCHVLWLLVAAALLVRAFVPVGYMTELRDSGTIAVALCTSEGVHLIELDDGADKRNDQERADPPCAFAGLSSPALPADTSAAPAVPAKATGDHAAHEVPAPSDARRGGPPPARAPPLSA
jgi:hypothetical protein